jgi:hypothetical protein
LDGARTIRTELSEKKMKFWRVRSPEYDSDYRHSYINGGLEHPFGLPGVICDVCGDTWGGSRILPFECPEQFRSHKNIIDGWPISVAEHIALQKDLMAVLPVKGESFVALCPGDDFQPCYLDVPSRPRADFLWSSCGALIVSERIKNTLVDCCPDDVAVCPVTLRKIGKREANLPPPMPSTGEPEDIINEVPIIRATSGIGPYFEVVVLKESGCPWDDISIDVCPVCRRPDLNCVSRNFRMVPKMWKGDSLFFLATTLHVIVTEEVRKRLAQHCPTNVVFEEV